MKFSQTHKIISAFCISLQRDPGREGNVIAIFHYKWLKRRENV